MKRAKTKSFVAEFPLHHFGDGKTAPVQRDLYSASLARYVVGQELSVCQVKEAWTGAEPLLRRATERWLEQVAREKQARLHARKRGRATRPSKGKKLLGKAVSGQNLPSGEPGVTSPRIP
jgi:hypothetical protein